MTATVSGEVDDRTPEEAVEEHDPLAVSFGPLGMGDGIPCRVFQVIGDGPFNASDAEEILGLVNADFEDDSLLLKCDRIAAHRPTT